MENELTVKIIGGAIVVGGAIIGLLLKILGKKKELKMQREDENEKRKKFNHDVLKAYDSINNSADNQQLICQNTTMDYPRQDGIRYKKEIENLENIVKYADDCIDAVLKNELNKIVLDMKNFQNALCYVNVYCCQNQQYQNTNAPVGTTTYNVLMQQSGKNNVSIMNALSDCDKLKAHWRNLYQGISSNLT